MKELQTMFLAEKMIVTGSVALAKYGLFTDKVGDVDILLLKPAKETIELIERLGKDFPVKRKPSTNKTFIGAFTKNDMKIEVFLADKEEFLTIDGLNYAKIVGIVKAKQSYKRAKDFIQLRKISRIFFKEEEFVSWLNTK